MTSLLFEFKDGTILFSRQAAIVTDTTVKVVTDFGLICWPREMVKRVTVCSDKDTGKCALPWSLLP